MKEFEPRPYQKKMFEQLSNNPAPNPLYWGRPRYVMGYDPGQKSGDKSVVSVMKMQGGHAQLIFCDEVSNLPDYKWYRNPIKWWKWRRMWKKVLQSANKRATLKGQL